jgi:hypothetical protein
MEYMHESGRWFMADLADRLGLLIGEVEAEGERRRRAGEEPDALTALVHELERVTSHAHDLGVRDAMVAAVTRHGPGPWDLEHLAVAAGVAEPDARRMLGQMVRDGLVRPPVGSQR